MVNVAMVKHNVNCAVGSKKSEKYAARMRSKVGIRVILTHELNC